MKPLRAPLASGAVALAWRVAFATAIVPTIVLSSIVTFYPLATIGTSMLLSGGLIASILAIVRTLQARAAARAWLVLAAAGIGAWALVDAVVLQAVWSHTWHPTDQLPWTATLRTLMWPMTAAGIFGTLGFARIATPNRRVLRMVLLLLLASWLPLHVWALFHPELGLVAIEELADHGLWVAALVVYPLEVLLVALSAAATFCTWRVACSMGSETPRLPVATARSRRSDILEL